MTNYTSSQFNVTVPCTHNNKKHLAMYNTLAKTLYIIESDIWAKLLDRCPLTSAPKDCAQTLVREGFLVPPDHDELDVYHHWKQQLVHHNKTTGSKTLLTNACNNGCSYCIKSRESLTMNEEVSSRVDHYYCQRINKNRPDKVVDDFLGGEPLLAVPMLLKMTGTRRDFCREINTSYRFSVTTNGRLLSPEIVRQLIGTGLVKLRVSMAGPARLHDTLRPGLHGEPTYGEILDKLAELGKLAPIHIQCQYDGHSADYRHLPQMLDDCIDRNINVLGVQFSPILERAVDNKFPGGLNDPRKAVWLQKEAARRGIACEAGLPDCNCIAELRSRYVFDCLGNILPCPSLQTGQLAYGDVYEGIDFRKEARLCQRRLPEGCLKDCPLLPICKGGCRNRPLVRSNDFDGIDCRREEMMFLLQHQIVTKIREAGVVFDAWDEVFNLPCASECENIDWH